MILHDFKAGTPKQISWAQSLRDKFVQLLLEANYSLDDIFLVVEVRCLAVWWIDNRNRLNLKEAPNIIRASKAAVTRAGSLSEAIDSQVAKLEDKILKAEARQLELERQETIALEEEYLEEVFEDRVRPW